MMSSINDENIQATNDDAINCKLSAINYGYWTDNYVQYFARQRDHKPPEINRGYYIRVKAIDNIISQIYELTKGQYQVVNLGAGYDTRFWNLYDENKKPLRWVEIDFEATVRKKIRIIKSKNALADRLLLDDGIIEASSIHSSSSVGYHLVSNDLRDIKSLEIQLLNTCGINTLLPTLFIAECVLVYLAHDESNKLLQWISSQFSNCIFINNEQVNLNDRFGEVMVRNLEKRGCPLLGYEHCISKKSQEDRFLKSGWDYAKCFDMLEVYKNLPPSESKRIESLEFLDDYEMVIQLFTHYCVVVAYQNSEQNSTFFSTINII